MRAAPVAGGGRIYALSERGDLLAVSPAGRVLWQARLGLPAGATQGGGGTGFTAPPLYLAGTIVVGDRGCTVYALDAATGRVRWQARVAGGVQGSPTFASPAGGAPAEVLVLSQADGRIVRFDLASGRESGASPPTNRCDGSAAVAAGALVYGNCDAALHFFSVETLRPLGRLDLERDGQVSAGVAVSGGVVYAGDRSGRLSGVDLATRRLLWSSRAPLERVEPGGHEGVDDGRFGKRTVAGEKEVRRDNRSRAWRFGRLPRAGRVPRKIRRGRTARFRGCRRRRLVVRCGGTVRGPCRRCSDLLGFAAHRTSSGTGSGC